MIQPSNRHPKRNAGSKQLAEADAPIRLSEEAEELGDVVDLSEKEKARLGLAKHVLSGVMLSFLVSVLVLLLAPESRIESVKPVFEFVKAMGPPIVTLVLGFYFRGSDT